MAEQGDVNTGLLNSNPRKTQIAGRTIRRNAYFRKNRTLVRAKMIRDVGAPGKWRSRHMGAPGIGSLKKGALAVTGYNVNSKATTRRHAVDRAVKSYGKLSTLRKLNAVAVYTRRTSPVKSRKFKSDVKYVQKKYY